MRQSCGKQGNDGRESVDKKPFQFSLCELVFFAIGAGGVVGVVTNNYWMEREVHRARTDTARVYEEILRGEREKRQNVMDKLNGANAALKKINPAMVKLYEYDDECDCDKQTKAQLKER